LTKKAPYNGLGADSEEKREPASDVDTALVDSLKALDPNRPIREADIATAIRFNKKPPSISSEGFQRCMKDKVISEISRSQIIGDSKTAVAIDPGSHLKDARAVAIEGRQQRLLATQCAGGELLQSGCGDEE
jgi:hypothetical protein